ncbi:protein of unknown function [Brochothrix thermosphacta]|uniref:Uncharacterized protein n=1 Tax=Brochothrix thermosphacta TaxID=2756 RepID=A0A2X0QKB8_BROTH|nr:hypothetical protein BTH160X_190009 [Brochothrix thermosphacta]SPN72899.1 protein of unknown function [Brochothrix thermosphacta]SPP28984.1 hypothetical protein BTBSAS_40008 [Brochothrix thermosphacta]
MWSDCRQCLVFFFEHDLSDFDYDMRGLNRHVVIVETTRE